MASSDPQKQEASSEDQANKLSKKEKGGSGGALRETATPVGGVDGIASRETRTQDPSTDEKPEVDLESEGPEGVSEATPQAGNEPVATKYAALL